MQEMKGRFINYDIVKRYIASAESSVTISFHDYDKTILQNTPRDINTIKKTKKDVKKNIIKDLIIMNKIQTMTRHMTYIFAQYVKSVIDEIIRTNHGNILTDEPEEKSKIVLDTPVSREAIRRALKKTNFDLTKTTTGASPKKMMPNL